MTDAQAALTNMRQAIQGVIEPAVFLMTANEASAILAHVDAQAAEIERLTAALRAQPGPVSVDDVEWAGKVHLAEAIRERDELRDVLLRNGFVPCDIPACNCGSWHHRYGLPERMQEIKDALAEAGHELSNANGHLPINALKALVAERDELRRQLDEAELDAERYRWLRNEANTARKCDPMVCIYPLDEQDLIDGDRLDIAIDAAMGLTRPAEEA